MRGGEVLELDASQRGPYVRPDRVLVSPVCTLAHGVSYVLEPPIQVLTDRQGAGVEHEAVCPVRERLRQLVGDFLAPLAGEIPALRAIRRVHPKAAAITHYASILVLDGIDAAFAVGALPRHYRLLS